MYLVYRVNGWKSLCWLPVVIGGMSLAGWFALRLVVSKPNFGEPEIRGAQCFADLIRLDAAAASWRASVLGLVLCAIAYTYNALDGVRRFASELVRPYPPRVHVELALLVGVAAGALVYVSSESVSGDIRLLMLAEVSVFDGGMDHGTTAATCIIRFVWAIAATMVVCAVWASVALIATPAHMPLEVSKAISYAESIARRVSWIRRTLLIGSLGPVIGVIEVIALAEFAARAAVDQDVKDAMITYGRAIALEVGVLFAFIQIGIYFPVAKWLSRQAHVMAQRHRSQAPPGTKPNDHYEAWLKECGMSDRNGLEPTARVVAVLSPFLAALASNFIELPQI